MSGHAEFKGMLRLAARGVPGFESESKSQVKFPNMCKPESILDRFELGDYGLHLYHCGSLLQFLRQVRRQPIPLNGAIYVQDHAVASSEIMNSGLRLARASEVRRFIRDLTEKKTFKKLRLISTRTGCSSKWTLISMTPSENRSVEGRLCTHAQKVSSLKSMTPIRLSRSAERRKA